MNEIVRARCKYYIHGRLLYMISTYSYKALVLKNRRKQISGRIRNERKGRNPRKINQSRSLKGKHDAHRSPAYFDIVKVVE